MQTPVLHSLSPVQPALEIAAAGGLGGVVTAGVLLTITGIAGAAGTVDTLRAIGAQHAALSVCQTATTGVVGAATEGLGAEWVATGMRRRATVEAATRDAFHTTAFGTVVAGPAHLSRGVAD